jgi:phenylacetate-CoA ligase
VAQECLETKDGPTIWEDCFYPEIIAAESLQPVPDVEEGELVFTSLIKEAMPIIRYRTRDLTRLLPGSCRNMRRMDKITGRSDDMMIIRGVNVFPSQIEEQILKVEGLSPHYQLEISRNNNLDELAINVEVREDDFGGDMRTHLAKELQHHIKSFIGISARVNLHDIGTVARSQGKAQRVIDKRNLT